MGDKEVKAFLKEAREQIKNKDYKSALKECRKVLNKDKNNYMALVFCGLSLSELDQPDQAIQVNVGLGVQCSMLEVLIYLIFCFTFVLPVATSSPESRIIRSI